jgi:hypothetical protein
MTVYPGYQRFFHNGLAPGRRFQLKDLAIVASEMNKLLTNTFVQKLPVSLVVK